MKLNTFLIRVFGNVMVILIIGFQILRLFCVAYGICAGKNFILQVHLILVLHSSINCNAWSMAEMLWQHIHEIFIYTRHGNNNKTKQTTTKQQKLERIGLFSSCNDTSNNHTCTDINSNHKTW